MDVNGELWAEGSIGIINTKVLCSLEKGQRETGNVSMRRRMQGRKDGGWKESGCGNGGTE